MLEGRNAADYGTPSHPPSAERGETIVSFADLTPEKSAALRETGQTMAEYAICLGVISLAVIAAFTALSGSITNALNNVIGFLP
jgi:Flp pilus assembly pilin Flp